MQRSDQINELAGALAKAQALIKQPAKTRTATIKSDKGSYGYKYADLPDIIDAYRQPFSDNGLSIVQSASTEERRVAVTTVLLHSSGQWIQDTLFMNVADSRPQAVGSAITYGRRYAISAMVGVAPDEDDDGQTAQAPSSRPPQRTQRPPARRADDGPVYDGKDTQEDIPFEGPPAKVGDGPEVYTASARQAAMVREAAKPFGITGNADLHRLSFALRGIDEKGKRIGSPIEMRHLAAAVKEWAEARQQEPKP